MTTTPNMSLILPDVSITPGPTWASELNTALQTVDSHNHTSGNGALVPTAGLNINADLSLGANNLYDIRTLRLNTQVSDPNTVSDIRILYAKSNELYYRDGAGTAVQITNNGFVNSGSGSISGLGSYSGRTATAAFNQSNFTFSVFEDTGKPAKFATADLLLSQFDTIVSNAVTLKSPNSLAASYSVTFPAAVPTQAAVLTMGTSGVLTTGLADGSEGAPSLPFSGDLTTGFYKDGVESIGVTNGGSRTAQFSIDGLRVIAGLAAGPSLSFLSDDATGFYQSGSGAIDVAISTVQTTSFVTQGVVARLAGSAAAPVFSLSDGNTGLYQSSSGILDATAGGTRALSVTATSLIARMNGTAAAPAFSLSDTHSGVYLISSGVLGLSGGSTLVMSLSSSSIVNHAPMSLPVGSAGAPTLNFIGDTTTGLYQASSGNLDVTLSGSRVLTFNSSSLINRLAGSASTPAYALPDLNSGIFQFTTGTVDITAGGVSSFTVGSATIVARTNLEVITGSLGSLSILFPDGTSGIFQGTAGQVNIATAGTTVFSALNSELIARINLGIVDGAAATPGIFFNTDTGTGIYKSGSHTLGVATNGSLQLAVGTTGVSVAGSLQVASGGAFKVAVKNDTLNGGQSQSFTYGSQIYGVCGFTQYADSGYVPVPTSASQVQSNFRGVWCNLSSANNVVLVQNNDSVNSRSYSLMVFYV